MKHRCDLLVILLPLLAAGLLFLLLRPSGAGQYVLVTVDGAEVGRYPLHEDCTVTIGEADYNILEIRDGSAAVTDANCGDHTCVRTGQIRRAGETIICLPHRLVVKIIGGGEGTVDAVSGGRIA